MKIIEVSLDVKRPPEQRAFTPEKRICNAVGMPASVKTNRVLARLALLAPGILSSATVADDSIAPVGQPIVRLLRQRLEGDLVSTKVEIDIRQHDAPPEF